MRHSIQALVRRPALLRSLCDRFAALPAQTRVVLAAFAWLGAVAYLWLSFNPEVALLFVGVTVLVGGAWWAFHRALRRRRDRADEGFLDELGKHWESGAAELKATGVDKHSLGFYPLIGEPQSGKTTTLMQSGLSFPIGMEKIEGTGGTKDCDWFFTDEAIILDTAGRLSFHEEDGDPRQNEAAFEEFLRRLVMHRPRCPINGVVVVIPCDSLLNDAPDRVEHKANVIRKALLQIEHSVGVQFPVYILLTKADMIGGFADFFGPLRAVERTQTLGWSRPVQRFAEPFRSAEVEHAFGAIVERLHTWRLAVLDRHGAEMDDDQRDRMFAFPGELARLRPQLERYLRAIFPESRLVDPPFLRGFYLTSGSQEDAPVMHASAEIVGRTDDGDEPPPKAANLAYFIGDVYRHKIFKEQGLVVPTRSRVRGIQRVQRIGYTVTAAAALAVVLMLASLTANVVRQVDRPKKLVAKGRTLIKDPTDTDWTPKELIDSRGKILDVLEAMAHRAPSGNAPRAGVLTELRRRELLGDVGWFSFGGNRVREVLLRDMWRAYRYMLVAGILEPLAHDLLDAVCKETPDGIAPPVAFTRYRAALRTLVAMACADAPGRKPVDIAPLLNYYQQRAAQQKDQWATLAPAEVERIAAAWRMLGECAPELAVPNKPSRAWCGTGGYHLWMGSTAKQRRFRDTLKTAFALVNQRWMRAFRPASGDWTVDMEHGASASGAASPYAWARILRLHHELRRGDRDLTATERVMLAPGAREAATDRLAVWLGHAGSWDAAYRRYADSFAELDAWTRIDLALAPERALAALRSAWEQEFYGTDDARGQPSRPARVASTDATSAIAGWIDDARNALAKAFDQNTQGFAELFSGTSKAPDVWVYREDADHEHHRIVLGAAPRARADTYGATAVLVREALQPLGGGEQPNPWVRILLPGAEHSRLAHEVLTDARAELTRHSVRLEARATKAADQPAAGTAAVRRQAVQAILAQVFFHLQQGLRDALPEAAGKVMLGARQEIPLEPARHVPDQFTRRGAACILGRLLVPLADWVVAMEPHEALGRGRDLLRVLDEIGADYVDRWFAYWTQDFASTLRQRVDRCIQARDIPALAQAVQRHFAGSDSLEGAARRLAAHTKLAFESLDIADPFASCPRARGALQRSAGRWAKARADLTGLGLAREVERTRARGGPAPAQSLQRLDQLEDRVLALLQELTDGDYHNSDPRPRLQRLLDKQ
ncbi:MAG: hypothetical protein KDC87_21155, partial [Planctomycetes bacterium]|nr:hypothetical protein [Planctomycetota bacterium]